MVQTVPILSNNVHNHERIVISGFRHAVNEVVALLACYVKYIGSYLPVFGTNYLSHIEGSSSPCRMPVTFRYAVI